MLRQLRQNEQRVMNNGGIIMKRTIILILLAALLWFCFIPQVQAETLRFATINYCPFTCDPALENGREGVLTEVLRAALEPAGITLELTMLPFLRAIQETQQGKYDGMVVANHELAPELVYPDAPTLRQHVAFLVKAGETWTYAGIDSLRTMKIGIVEGYSYADADLNAYLKEHQKDASKIVLLHGQNTTEQGIQMLLKDRFTLYLEGAYSAQYVLMKLGLQDQVAIVGYSTGAFDDFTAFASQHPKARQYAALLSQAIKEMTASGKLKEILQKYGIREE